MIRCDFLSLIQWSKFELESLDYWSVLSFVTERLDGGLDITDSVEYETGQIAVGRLEYVMLCLVL